MKEDATTHTKNHGLTSGVTGDTDKEVGEVTDMFADLAKKVRTPTSPNTGAKC